MNHKNFVAVRTQYYKHCEFTKKVKKRQKVNGASSADTKYETVIVEKKYKSAIAELDHIVRAGATKSANVHSEFTKNNITITPDDTGDIIKAYYDCRARYKETTGREFRSDGNVLFEHVLVLSEEHVSWLEDKLGQNRTREEIVDCIEEYAEKFAEKFGFFFIGSSLHFDEGRYDENGVFIRNIHAHVCFFNYSFEQKRSNLKFLAYKGKDKKTGRTNILNENFVEIQSLSHRCFSRLRFKRGQSKLKTLTNHLSKQNFIIEKIKKLEGRQTQLIDDIKLIKEQFFSYFQNWFKRLVKSQSAEVQAHLSAASASEIHDPKLKKIIKNHVSKTEQKLEQVLNENIDKNENISPKIK
ncbi:MAG: hypothetical protein JKY10_12310 [Cohaesibacteraceae bacterium]|nr:hypothetical protein [Cohaesibacteraceae bacterium]